MIRSSRFSSSIFDLRSSKRVKSSSALRTFSTAWRQSGTLASFWSRLEVSSESDFLVMLSTRAFIASSVKWVQKWRTTAILSSLCAGEGKHKNPEKTPVHFVEGIWRDFKRNIRGTKGNCIPWVKTSCNRDLGPTDFSLQAGSTGRRRMKHKREIMVSDMAAPCSNL